MEPRGLFPRLQKHSTSPCSEPDQSNPCPHPAAWWPVLILSSQIHIIGLPSDLFPSGFPTKPLYAPVLSPYMTHDPHHQNPVCTCPVPICDKWPTPSKPCMHLSCPSTWHMTHTIRTLYAPFMSQYMTHDPCHQNPVCTWPVPIHDTWPTPSKPCMHLSSPALGPTQPSVQWVLGLFRGNAARAWHWPPTPI